MSLVILQIKTFQLTSDNLTLTPRFYQFSKRLGIILIDHLIMTILTFLLLTFVLYFKDFLREIIAIVN